MQMTARLRNARGRHQLEVMAGTPSTQIQIAPKASGFGSSVSGGEMLLAALATCYCNDVYREAGKMGIEVFAVEVDCQAEFPAEGEPARAVTYSTRIRAKASEAQIQDLAARTDRMAEIHNTLRAAIPVRLGTVEAQSEQPG